jgi:hypothetical protein
MRFPHSLLVAACVVAVAQFSSAYAQISPIKMRVTQTGKTDRDDKDKHKSSQEKVLNIEITNSAKEAMDLKIKYTVFGRDLRSKDIVGIADGEMPAALKPQSTEKFTTPKAQSDMEEETGAGKDKKVAKGAKMIGYGVQVLKGETVVAEAYEPSAMKASFGKVVAPTAAK